MHNAEYTTDRETLNQIAILENLMAQISTAHKEDMPSLKQLKTYFTSFAQYDEIRNKLMVQRIDTVKKPTLLRVGTAHSFLRKLIDTSRYEVETILTPFIMNHFSQVIREYQLGKEASDTDLYKAWVTYFLYNDEITCKSLLGKTEYEINFEDDNFRNLFMRILLDNTDKDLSMIGAHNMYSLFTSQ